MCHGPLLFGGNDEEDADADVEDIEEPKEEDVPSNPNSVMIRNILASFVILTAVGLMAVIFPFGITLAGSALGAQVLIFSLGAIIFFLEIAFVAV